MLKWFISVQLLVLGIELTFTFREVVNVSSFLLIVRLSMKWKCSCMKGFCSCHWRMHKVLFYRQFLLAALLLLNRGCQKHTCHFCFFIQNTLKCEFTVAASPFCTEQFHKCENGSCRNRYVCSLMDTAIHKGKLL